MSVLPWELHNLILGYLALPVADSTKQRSLKDIINQATLLSYSCAARQCCIRARRHVFSSIALRINASFHSTAAQRSAIKELNRFATVLNNSLLFPDLGMAYHIQSFIVQTWKLEGPLGDLGILLQEGSMTDILDTLHGPRHGIRFFGWQHLGGQFPYHKLEDFMDAFDKICHSRDLQHLLISGFYPLPVELLHNSNLKRLELYQTLVISAGLELEGGFYSPVEYVGLDETTHYYCNKPNRVHSPHLTDIFLRLPYLHAFPKAVFIAANTLRVLRIHVDLHKSATFDETPTYPLRLLTRLESLYVYQHTALQIHDGWVITPLIRFLDSVSFPSSLNSLSLLTTSRHGIDLLDLANYLPKNEEGKPHREAWGALDALLTKSELATISKLTITVQLDVQFRYSNNAGIDAFDFESLCLRNKDKLLDILPMIRRARTNQHFLEVKHTILDIDHIHSFDPLRNQKNTVAFRVGGRMPQELPAVHGQR